MALLMRLPVTLRSGLGSCQETVPTPELSPQDSRLGVGRAETERQSVESFVFTSLGDRK